MDPAAMVQADAVDTRRGDLLQGAPQVIRLGTLSLISLDITAKELARRRQQEHHWSTRKLPRRRNSSRRC